MTCKKNLKHFEQMYTSLEDSKRITPIFERMGIEADGYWARPIYRGLRVPRPSCIFSTKEDFIKYKERIAETEQQALHFEFTKQLHMDYPNKTTIFLDERGEIFNAYRFDKVLLVLPKCFFDYDCIVFSKQIVSDEIFWKERKGIDCMAELLEKALLTRGKEALHAACELLVLLDGEGVLQNELETF